MDSLLADLSGDDPCGENLEYDPAFLALEQAALPEPEHQMGDSVIEAREPDWRAVRDQALALCERSRDLRVAVYLALAELALDGVRGFAQGLRVVTGLVTGRWAGVWPRLDEAAAGADDPD